MFKPITSILKLLFFILFLSILTSCSTSEEGQWIITCDGECKIWLNNPDEKFSYSWEGEKFDSLAHGEGLLCVFLKDSLVEKRQLRAFYGSVSSQDIVEIGDSERYIGNLKGNKFDGYGCYYKNGDIYIGSFKESIPHGFLTWYKGENPYYIGEWRNGKFHGKGILYKEDGTVRSGDWENGTLLQTEVDVKLKEGHYTGFVKKNVPDGIGTMEFSNGAKYNGNWENGKFNGEGVYTFRSDTIIGDWENGKLFGDVLFRTNKLFYEGSVYDNKPTGLGNLIIADESYYTGFWDEGKREGIGDIYFVNGDSYSGEWSNNKFNGNGKYFYDNINGYYDGNWENGLQNGEGLFKCPEFSYLGFWEKGWMDGEGTLSFKNGDIYEGTIHENLIDGIGIYKFSDGNIYEGEFVEGQMSGMGIFHFKNGSTYEGEFFNNRIYGDGTLTLKENGKLISITGFWPKDSTFPNSASVLFSNGDLYEGPLENGYPTNEGSWISGEDRKKKIENVNNSSLHQINEFYKKHRETINWCVAGVSIAVSCIPGCGEDINKTINYLDMEVAIASASIDVAEANALGEDNTEAVENLRNEIVLNVASIAIPKGFKQLSKLGKPLKNVVRSKAAALALKYGGQHIIKNSSIKLVKGKIFGKKVSVVIEHLKNGSKKITNTFKRHAPLPVIAGRTFSNPKRIQYITSKKWLKKGGVKIINSNGSSSNLSKNMESVGGNKMKKFLEKNKRLATKYGKKRSQVEAHHILTPNPNKGRLSPKDSKILAEAQEFMKETLGCLDHPMNGIYVGRGRGKDYIGLAKGASHGIHSSEYNMKVARKILNAKNLAKTKYKGDPKMQELLLLETLDEIKKDIVNGKLLIEKAGVIHTNWGYKIPKIN